MKKSARELILPLYSRIVRMQFICCMLCRKQHKSWDLFLNFWQTFSQPYTKFFTPIRGCNEMNFISLYSACTPLARHWPCNGCIEKRTAVRLTIRYSCIFMGHFIHWSSQPSGIGEQIESGNDCNSWKCCQIAVLPRRYTSSRRYIAAI